MGYLRRHAIIVSDSGRDSVKRAHAEALRLFANVAPVTEITDGAINGEQSFMVAPDGSKEWWADSDRGNERRAAFVAWLRAHRDVEWVEVTFGTDDPDARVLNSSDHDRLGSASGQPTAGPSE